MAKTSGINDTVPTAVTPTISSVRTNFVTAKAEITELFASVGTPIPGPTGNTGATGATGGTGTGTAGATGAAGSKWLSGAVAPTGGQGAIGDWYFNTADASIHEKINAVTWSPRGNLRGPTGATGATGTGGDGSGRAPAGFGAAPPSFAETTNADNGYFFFADDGTLYICKNRGWIGII